MKQGTRYEGAPGLADYQMIEYSEYGQLIEKESSPERGRRRTAISTMDLMDDLTLRNFSELQWRLSVVFMIPIIGVLAIPLSRVNPRQGRFTRLVPGMILCFLYVVSLSAARSAMEKQQIPEAIGIWWVHVLYLGLIVLLYRIDTIGLLIRNQFMKRPKLTSDESDLA